MDKYVWTRFNTFAIVCSSSLPTEHKPFTVHTTCFH